MICVSIQNKEFPEIQELLPSLEMAEIRLDRCALSDEEIEAVVAMHRKENAGNNTVVCPHCGATLHVELTKQDAPKDAHPA